MTFRLRFETGGILARHASILDALSDSFSIRAPSKLTSLSLKNLRTCDLTSLESSSSQAVLKNLRRLQLYMNHDRAEGIITSSDESDPCLPFWGTFFHRVVLNPTQHSLTELYTGMQPTRQRLVGAVLRRVALSIPLCALSAQYRLRAVSRRRVFHPSTCCNPRASRARHVHVTPQLQHGIERQADLLGTHMGQLRGGAHCTRRPACKRDQHERFEAPVCPYRTQTQDECSGTRRRG